MSIVVLRFCQASESVGANDKRGVRKQLSFVNESCRRRNQQTMAAKILPAPLSEFIRIEAAFVGIVDADFKMTGLPDFLRGDFSHPPMASVDWIEGTGKDQTHAAIILVGF